MALQLSSDDALIINSKLSIDKPQPITDEKYLETQYEISTCIEWIKNHNFTDVALQFPDHMLVDSATVATHIGKLCSCQVYILADTSYGSCCVDEVAAEHVSADAIIHFGHSCLSPTSHLPVLFVFGKKPVDLNDAVEQFRELFPEKNKRIIIVYDVVYAHAAELLYAKLHLEYSYLILSIMITEKKKTPKKDLCSGCKSCKDQTKEQNSYKILSPENVIFKIGRQLKLHEGCSLPDYTMFYIGQQGQCLINLIMTFNQNDFYSYDPETKMGKKEMSSINKALMKRYYLIEKAKDANIVGILIGTLGVSDYLTIIKQLKQIIKDAGKKSYTIVVGKINVAKLANFPEIDVYVLVACSENTLIASKDFFRPIVTPYEMEIACNAARSWTGNYITDFRLLLPGAEEHVPFESSEDTEVSLTTGRVRQLAVHDGENAITDDRALIKRDNMVISLHQNAAGEFLANRSWKGLDVISDIAVEKAAEGRDGIAAGYKNEQELYDKDLINST